MHTISTDEYKRYHRQVMLPGIGEAGQQQLNASRVLVVGAGGLGCPALQYLCAAGVGTIGIVDFDTVEIHNLNRQVLYTAEDTGRSKAETAAAKLKQQNPHLNYVVYNEMLKRSNARDIIRHYDVVLDGSDNFACRYLVNDTCVELGKPLVYGSILKFEAQLAVFNYKGSKQLRDLYPEAPNEEDVPGCNEAGVLGVVPGIVGTYMALYAIQILLGKFEAVDQLFIFDFWNARQECFSF